MDGLHDGAHAAVRDERPQVGVAQHVLLRQPRARQHVCGQVRDGRVPLPQDGQIIQVPEGLDEDPELLFRHLTRLGGHSHWTSALEVFLKSCMRF